MNRLLSDNGGNVNWREHSRIIAIVANAMFVVLLFGSRGWFISMGLGVPLIVYPVVALVALMVNGNRPRM